MCRSVPQTPVRSTLMSTSSRPIEGIGTSSIHSPGSDRALTRAFIRRPLPGISRLPNRDHRRGPVRGRTTASGQHDFIAARPQARPARCPRQRGGYGSAVPVVEAVLLDAGGVLILPSPEVVLPALRAAGVTPRVDVLERAHYRAMAAADGAGPPDLDGAGPPALDGAGGPAVRMDWPHYFAAYATCCCVPRAMVGLVADDLAVAVRGGFTWSHVISAAARTLRRITELGNKVAIVSNSDGSVADALFGLGVCHHGA